MTDYTISYTAHAYWPAQPHTMPRPIRWVVVCDSTPLEVLRALLRDLGKKPDLVRIANAKTGGAAVITTDGEPIPLAYINEMSKEEAAEAVLALRTERA